MHGRPLSDLLLFFLLISNSSYLFHVADAVEALKLHRKQHVEERAAAGRRRWKALDSPKDCAYIQIDGMDHKKIALPHFSKQPKSVDGAALFSTVNTGEPPAGVRNITHIDGTSVMLASQKLLLKSYAEIKWQTRRVQNIGPLGGELQGDAVLQPEKDVDNDEEPVAVTTAEELKRRIFGHRRPIYFGPGRPPPGSAVADRAAHIDELTEIQEKSFLVVLAEDEISFWICQVLKINTRIEAEEPRNVQIQ
ncbi:hypothetical protein R1sor_012790 [Riccia sorocarpa]|uniref:Uncharacterized protein n=1 Tax=Riccia sorocarpa TaxID=122646 RepID=A0ABD3I847_9MARC